VRARAPLAALLASAVLSAQVPPPPPADPASSHRVISAPALSLGQVRRVLNSAALSLLLSRDYTEAGSEADWKTRGVPGVVLERAFSRAVDGGRRTVELAAIPGVAGGYDLHLYARELGKDVVVPNPDLPAVEESLRQLVATATTAAPPAGAAPPGVPGMPPGVPGQPGAPTGDPNAPAAVRTMGHEELGHVVYDLSYTHVDRAMATLKALGYSTVEFTTAAGESPYEKLYSPSTTNGRPLPVIVKLLDAPKTSLMDSDPSTRPAPGQMAMPMPQQFGAAGKREAVPDIGGTFLHTATSGEPQQRLLILYDKSDSGAMERLAEVLREEIDVAARQVVISALVLEVNTDKARELGVQFSGSNGKTSYNNTQDANGVQQPFTFTFDSATLKGPFEFNVKLKALVEHGDAEILSNPSVLVLDGRQARIQVGQQVPVVNSTSTAAGITSSVEYFPVGIVLNLRPRISKDGSEVTMQVETIVSAVATQTQATASVFYAPTVDNRQVQTFVRVADNTPFIIGGLISSSDTKRRSGLPWLSRIPILGALFGQDTANATKREVIVVLTPHVVPDNDPSFSYVIPKDAGRFDSFGHLLFRNSYRIRTTDVFDLEFIHESEVLGSLVAKIRARAEVDPSVERREPYASLLAGHAPGEEILVHRMLWEIVRRSGYGQKIDLKKVLVFQPSASDPQSTDFELSFLEAKLAGITPAQNALLLTFDAVHRGTPEHPFAQPKATITYESVTKDSFEKRLIETNRRAADGTPETWTVLLSNAYTGTSAPLDTLRSVLVLKRVLALNSSLPRTVQSFNVGRQIIFPTEEDIARNFHVIDHQVARLFYEVTEYYRAFEQEFNRATRRVIGELEHLSR